MVYPPKEVTHPSTNRARRATNSANHDATPPSDHMLGRDPGSINAAGKDTFYGDAASHQITLPTCSMYVCVCVCVCVWTVSQTLDDFRQRLSMSNDEITPLEHAITAIETGDSRAMTSA